MGDYSTDARGESEHEEAPYQGRGRRNALSAAAAVLGGAAAAALLLCATLPLSGQVRSSPSEHAPDIRGQEEAGLALLQRIDATLIGDDGVVVGTLTLHVADTPEARQRGLQGVARLPAGEGMLFWFDEQGHHGGFWMKDVPMPLDVVFLSGEVQGGWQEAARAGAELAVLEKLTMTPCVEGPCPTYHSSRAYRAAFEVAAGTLPALPPGATIRLHHSPTG